MKKALCLSAIAFAVLTGCNATSPTTQTVNLVPEQLVVSPNDQRQYRTVKLSNEIEVILVSDETIEKSAAALSVGVGLLHDPMTQQGMAHYLEHMLFLGTERFPDSKEYSEFMTKNGGAHNAYTWLDITNYMFEVNNDAYGEALDRFSDFFKAPKLYPEYTEKEKSAVNAEWSMRREIDFFGQFKLARKMMGDHPANRFLIGNLETLGDKEGSKLHTDTVAFFNQYYSSNIMKLALISNSSLDEMEAMAKQYFANIPNKNIEKPKVTKKIDLADVGGKKVFYAPNEDVKQLILDFTIENNLNDFAVKPNRFLSYLLYSEMPGTPAQVLREKGWISSLTSAASSNHYGNYGQFSVNVNLTDLGMQHRDEIIATIMRYIELIKKDGVNSKYFSEIRTALNNEFQFLEKSNSFGYVSNLAQSMQDYPLNNAINANYYYAQFDEKAINAVLEQLSAKNLRIWYISQQEETDQTLHFYDGKYRIDDISATEAASWQQPSEFALSLPNINRMLPESFELKQRDSKLTEQPQLVVDEKGIKVWQFASKLFANQPKGLIEVYVNNPRKQADIDTAILLDIWADLYALETAALATEASTAGMDITFDGANGFIFTINGFTDKQPELLTQGLSSIKLNPSTQDFEQAVDRYVRGLANQGKQFPFQQAFAEYTKLTRSGNYDKEVLIQRAKQLKVANLQALINDTLSQNQVRAFVFGNYDAKDIKTLTSQLAKELPRQEKVTDFARTKSWLPEPGQVLVMTKDIDVADVAVIDVHMHPEKGDKQKAQGRILQSHFRTVAFDKLRTEEQLAYAVGGFSPNLDDYAGLGLYIQTPVKGPEEMQARFDKFKLEYKAELDKMTPEVFAQLKNAALVALTQKPKNLREEVGPYFNDWYRENFEFDSKAKLIAEVEKVTLDDLKDFYAKTMLNSEAPRLNLQMRGNKFKDSKFATLKGQTVISDIAQIKSHIRYQ